MSGLLCPKLTELLYKVIPKHIGHLVGHEGDVEIPFNASQLILQTGVILGCARRHDILDPAHLIYIFSNVRAGIA